MCHGACTFRNILKIGTTNFLHHSKKGKKKEKKDNMECNACRTNVVSLSDGVSANVVFVWKEIRGSHQRHYSLSQKRALHSTLPSNPLGSSQKSVC